MTNKIMFKLIQGFSMGYNYIEIVINLLMSLMKDEGGKHG